ncbi:RsiV family protein [Aquimarina sp. AU119]|uniref:RsiV family protein n=1 Tax=Aquimarina sp. AU119 TaxID=2108528 RepID=UPI000D68AD8C|nr:RsiV family protein [Aquimarina sp. AU119]
MKKLIYISLAIILISCNTISNDSRFGVVYQDSKTAQISDEKSDYWLARQNTLQENFISTQKFYKEEGSLILDYKYPHLDEEYNPVFSSFNSFIEKTYLRTEKSVQQVLHNNDLSCDPIFKDAERKRRNIDYKIYTKNDQFLSVLLYKTNYYDEEHHNSFMFKGLNYDLKTGMFITYSDLFENNSDKFLLFKLNQELQARIGGQDSFNDCWEFTKDKFEVSKNNFVVNSEHIKFYFDDCAVCPTYSGNYFLEIPLEELSSILKTGKSESSYFKS